MHNVPQSDLIFSEAIATAARVDYLDAKQLVDSWLEGRAQVDSSGTLELTPAHQTGLSDKFRRAYVWIVENAILTPYADIEAGTPRRIGRGECELQLFDQPTYASFVLLPLLTLATSRRLVFLGAPGRGKTSVATLMGMLAGDSLDQVRRSIQHGHPQLTIHDLLGSPLPSQLMEAGTAAEVRVDWRSWITRRVKIIDEYNRIPTKTQSALLSLMADGYAEMYEQTVSAGTSAWYLTANDDLGGGTFPVIEALKDRIDIVVRCSPFHAQYLHLLAARIADNHSAEDFLPSEMVFSAGELAEVDRQVRRTRVPTDVLDLVGFFLGQLDFCRRASTRLEFMNKDTLHLAGRRVGHVCNGDCPLDKQLNLCSQTENGVSPRAFQSVLHYAQALAWFHGRVVVEAGDVRQIVPWVLFDRLRQNPQAEFFQKVENKQFTTDRVSWIQQLFDQASQQHAAYRPVREPILALAQQAEQADSMSYIENRQLQFTIEQITTRLLAQNELNGPVYDDLLRLKSMHSRLQRLNLHTQGG